MSEFKRFLNEGYTKSMGYKSVEEKIEFLSKTLNPNGSLCKKISKDSDDVTSEFKKMNKLILEIQDIWEEVERSIEQN